MEGTLQNKRARQRLPRLLLRLELSSQTGHALMTDMPLISHCLVFLFTYGTILPPAGCIQGMGVPAMGWAPLVAKGIRISTL